MKRSMIVMLLLAVLVATACGESQADKAKSQVCDARADIKKQVDELSGLTLGTATIDGITANLTTIRTDLGKMKDAQGDLSDERKQQVTAANQAFTSQVTSVVKSVGTSTSLTQAATQIQTALGQLADSYKQTLGKIDC